MLDRSVQGEEPLVVFKIFECSLILKNDIRNTALQRKGMEIARF
jgi:hypothetical protein